MEEYVLLIEGKKHNNVFIKCKNLNEVEKKIFEFSEEVNNFEVYKAINISEYTELVELVFKRFINNLK